MVVVPDAAQSSEWVLLNYPEVDDPVMECRFARAPKLLDVPYPVQMKPNLVVAFYGR
jgi:small subunit ribosomal protein S4